MLAHVPSFGRNPRGSLDFLAYPVPRACMHVLGTGVPRRLGVARSASSPNTAQALGCSLTPGRLAGSPAWHRLPQCLGYAHWVSYCCLALVFGSGLCLGWGFGCARPLLTGLMACVCVCVRAPLVPRHSCLGCAVCVCVLGLGFRLRFATPGCGVGACVCLCARSACTPPLLAGVCGVHVCVRARYSAAPRHSWLGFWDPCVLVCAPPLYPATPGWGVRCGCVCLGSGFGCAPPLVAGVLGCVCVCLRSPLVPRLSWVGSAVCVCVPGLWFWLRPASPGWGVEAFVCLCARSACTPPFLAGV